MKDDTYCLYCQVEYETTEKLIEHLKKEHEGTYAYWSIAMQGQAT